MRGIFFDEDTARLVERRLLADGFTADVSRERYAGEDDDEDHPWAVTTDAPATVLDILVDTYDGWLDDEAPAAAADVVPPLPQGPIRLYKTD